MSVRARVSGVGTVRRRTLLPGAVLGLAVLFGALPGAAQSADDTSAAALSGTVSSTTEPAEGAATTASTAASSTTASTTASSTTSSTAASSTTTSTGSSTTTSDSTTSTTTASSTTTSAGGSDGGGGGSADDQQKERERIEAAEAAKAREVDAANAALGDVTNALKVLQQRVDAQTGRLNYANERLATAEASVAATTEEVEIAESEITDLETRLAEQAIRTFMGDEGDQVILANIPDPNEALRRQTLLAQVTQTDVDLVTDLRAAQEDLNVRRAEALDAADAADSFRADAQEQLESLEADQDAQGAVTAAAELRLDHLLSERAALAVLGEDLAAGEPVEDELVDQLTSSPPPADPSPRTVPPDVVGEDDIAYAGNGIYVHVSIVDDIRQLLVDAAADGVDLAGGGFRSAEGQIRTRRANCGTSDYAVYEMPASQCRPPTARPGRSMHEQGKAIDFTYNGRLIRSRSGRGWAWLRDNAAKYGLQNLPSEAWHWSVNGR